jgi:hypothetical protein
MAGVTIQNLDVRQLGQALHAKEARLLEIIVIPDHQSRFQPCFKPQLSQNAPLCVGPLVHEVHKVFHSRETEGDVHIGEKGDPGVDSTINEQES